MPNQIRNVAMSALAAAAIVAMPSVGRAQGEPIDKRTIYTFSNPVELPGVGLQPGQYVFRLADPTTSRKMIQVVSLDGKQVYGTFFSVPIELPEAPSKAEARFMEAAPGAPAPIRAVWYANERIGSEFIYPREQAMRIAKGAREPVLTTATSTTKAQETNSGELTRVQASGQNAPMNSANQAASSPSTVTRSTPEAFNRAPAQVAANREALPRTGSSLPMVALLGLFGFAAAAALRLWFADDRR